MTGRDVTGRDGRLGVGVVGAGRVGAVLGAALGGAGHAVVGVSAVSESSRERAEALLPGVPVLEVFRVVELAELVVLAVPETELAGLVDGLAVLGAWQPGQLVLHTSPGQGVGVLGPAVAAGAIGLALHPALAFTGTSLDLARLREARSAVTAAAPVLPIGLALAMEIGTEPVVVAEADRPAYAAALAAASEFSTAVVDRSIAALAGIGVGEPAAVLGPLVRSAIDNALAAAPAPDLELPDPKLPGPELPGTDSADRSPRWR